MSRGWQRLAFCGPGPADDISLDMSTFQFEIKSYPLSTFARSQKVNLHLKSKSSNVNIGFRFSFFCSIVWATPGLELFFYGKCSETFVVV